MKFSANLGFLWTELGLADAIHAAKAAGFDAVECHWPFDMPSAEVVRALDETGLTMLGLNTSPGDRAAGEFGLAALPGREADAHAVIDQAIEYATEISAPNVHVMAGFAEGPEAEAVFINNLVDATDKASKHEITILIEPLNSRDAPGYFLRNSGQARSIIESVDAPNLKLMFDCYHLQIMEGDISARLSDLMPIIGHIQFAAVPDRTEPDSGELNYGHIFRVLDELGYRAPLGAEYKPRTGRTEDGLGWMSGLR